MLSQRAASSRSAGRSPSWAEVSGLAVQESADRHGGCHLIRRHAVVCSRFRIVRCGTAKRSSPSVPASGPRPRVGNTRKAESGSNDGVREPRRERAGGRPACESQRAFDSANRPPHREVLQPVVTKGRLPRHVTRVTRARLVMGAVVLPHHTGHRVKQVRNTEQIPAKIKHRLVAQGARQAGIQLPHTNRVSESCGDMLSSLLSWRARRTRGTPSHAFRRATYSPKSRREMRYAAAAMSAATTASRSLDENRMWSNSARCTVVHAMP
jgi:hypothetical protein